MLTNKKWYLLSVGIVLCIAAIVVVAWRFYNPKSGIAQPHATGQSSARSGEQSQSASNASDFQQAADASMNILENETSIAFDPVEIELKRDHSITPLTIRGVSGSEIVFNPRQIDLTLASGRLLKHGTVPVANGDKLDGGQAYILGGGPVIVAIACAFGCEQPELMVQSINQHQPPAIQPVKINLSQSAGQWSTRQKFLMVLAALVVLTQAVYLRRAFRRRRQAAKQPMSARKTVIPVSSLDRISVIPAGAETKPVTSVLERAEGAAASAGGVTRNQPVEVPSGQTTSPINPGRTPSQTAPTDQPAISADDQLEDLTEDLTHDVERLRSAVIEVVHKSDDASNDAARAENSVALLAKTVDDYRTASQGEAQLLRQKVEQITNRLAALEETAQKQWPGLLAQTLQSSAEIAGPAAELEPKLREFFGNVNADTAQLGSLAKTAGLIAKTLSELRAWVTNNCPDSQNEFAEMAMQGTDLCEEIAVVEENLRSRSLRLKFSCEVAAFQGSRRDFFESLGSSLAQEITKWQDPVSYFSRKVKEVARAAAYECCDTADTRLDADRTNLQLQPLLLSLVRACGLEQIAPLRGDAYQPALHDVVQSVSARNSYPSQSVAQTTIRGFVQQNEVVRKARIIVFR